MALCGMENIDFSKKSIRILVAPFGFDLKTVYQCLECFQRGFPMLQRGT